MRSSRPSAHCIAHVCLHLQPSVLQLRPRRRGQGRPLGQGPSVSVAWLQRLSAGLCAVMQQHRGWNVRRPSAPDAGLSCCTFQDLAAASGGSGGAPPPARLAAILRSWGYGFLLVAPARAATLATGGRLHPDAGVAMYSL